MNHPSHKTRLSDSSLYDEVCTLCGATDRGVGLRSQCPVVAVPDTRPAVSCATGRFDASKENRGNTPKRKSAAGHEGWETSPFNRDADPNRTQVDPPRLRREVAALVPKEAVEIVPGKKYVAIFDTRGLCLQDIDRITRSTPRWGDIFKSLGIDIVFMCSHVPLKLYEVEGSR